MAHNSGSGRKGGQQKPPFEIVLDEACSIVCDDLPLNCTIRVMPVNGRSPPRVSPASKWVEDCSAGRSPGGRDWSPFPRDKYGKVGRSPSPTMRSRRSIVESVRRNIWENNYGGGGAPSSSGIHTGPGVEEEQDVFALRKAYCKHERSSSWSPSPTPSVTSATSYGSCSSRQPSPSSSSPPPPPQSAATDRLLNPNRPQRDFRIQNIKVDALDLREMHPNVGSPGSSQVSTPPAERSAKATTSGRVQSQWEVPSSCSCPPSYSKPSRPSPPKGGRCCAMADYNPSHFRSKTPERDGTSSGSAPRSRDASPSRGAGGAALCSYHGAQPCPAQAGARCRANNNSGGGLRGGAISCPYHEALPCPALAGVPCRYHTTQLVSSVDAPGISARDAAAPAGQLRSAFAAAPVGHLRIRVRKSKGEIQKSGTSSRSPSRPPSPSPRDPRSTRSPRPDTWSQGLPEPDSRPGSPSRSAGVSYPPRTISPPPRSPRSRTPARSSPQKNRGAFL